MNEWNIQSRAHACEVCGQAFADKQSYHTVLFDEAPLLRRSDICEACAKKVNDQRSRAGFISQWQGTYEAPPAQPVEAIQKDTAETLLRKLVALNEPRHAPAAFILAVMLERKRLLKVKEQFTRDGQKVYIYEHPKSGDVFAITDPDLHLDQLQQVQHDVAHLLEHGLEQPAVPEPAIPAPVAADPAEPAAEVVPGVEAPPHQSSEQSPESPAAEPSAAREAAPVAAT
jgi:hypothetical protein